MNHQHHRTTKERNMIAMNSSKTRTAKKVTAVPMSKNPSSAFDDALSITVPAWPLQNAVAVNPFWNLRSRPFATVMSDLAPVLHSPLYMPLSYYLDRYRNGAITEDSLAIALDAAKARLAAVPETLDEVLQASAGDGSQLREVTSFGEFCDRKTGSSWQLLVSAEISKYASAFFDDGQALAAFPWNADGLWSGWRASLGFDRSMEAGGVKGFRDSLRSLTGKNPKDFIDAACSEVGLISDKSRALYFSRLFAQNFGWSSQFRYIEWQRGLGYEVAKNAEPSEWLAILVAYDVGIVKFADSQRPGLKKEWAQTFDAAWLSEQSRVHDFALHELWQQAFELSYQRKVASSISLRPVEENAARFQIAMCIDVRSEMLRRHIESTSSDVKTIGFAGFFGVPFDYKKIDEKSAGHRLPVLLTPAFSVNEVAAGANSQSLQDKSFFRGYFRGLRKSSLGAFLYVEICGFFALWKMLKRFGASLVGSKPGGVVPERFSDRLHAPSQTHVSTLRGEQLDLRSKVERAAAVLKHMGLTKNFARVVVIAGHGSATTNNAFASSLDCGACGGHAGDINARFLAGLLNENAVREGLRTKGIAIPETTSFVPAIHETVTDRIYLLDEGKIPASHRDDVRSLKSVIETAGEATSKERHGARSAYLDPEARRRAANWSEVRPEWGLAGNACFIVAPRRWTTGANLSSRSFLHDYDWRADEGFTTLELILTAPMVVTNWINMQYYASTVAPDVYGAGNKILHNVVNECGVLEGNTGDLRVGLPIQSVHDGEKFVHEPLRLSVFLAAPREEIERIVAKHAVVRDLLDHEWLHLLHIDEVTNVVCRRAPGGLYQPI